MRYVPMYPRISDINLQVANEHIITLLDDLVGYNLFLKGGTRGTVWFRATKSGMLTHAWQTTHDHCPKERGTSGRQIFETSWYHTERPNFVRWSNWMGGKFLHVEHAPCTGRSFYGTNAVVRFVCGSKPFCLYSILVWRFGVAVTRWSRSTQLLYIEPG